MVHVLADQLWHMMHIMNDHMIIGINRVLTTRENPEIYGNLLILENLGNLKYSLGCYFCDAI